MCWSVGGGEGRCGEVLGKGVEKYAGMWGIGGDVGGEGKCRGRCEKVCWGVG